MRVEERRYGGPADPEVLPTVGRGTEIPVSLRVLRERKRRIIGVVDDVVARERSSLNRARIVYVLRLAVAVAALEREPTGHLLRETRRDVPLSSDAFVRQHDVLNDLVAHRVVQSGDAWTSLTSSRARGIG